MKNSLLNTIMTWILAAGLILSVFFAYKYFRQTREMLQAQFAIQRYQSTHQILNVLLNDVVEYSKKDPGITPILDSIGVRMKNPNAPAGSAGTSNGAAASKPTGK